MVNRCETRPPQGGRRVGAGLRHAQRPPLVCPGDDAEAFGNPDYWNYRNLLKQALLPLHVLGGKRVLEYCGKACNVCKTHIRLALTRSLAGDELAASCLTH